MRTGKEAMNVADRWPVRPVLPFHRVRDLKARELHEITVLMPGTDLVSELSLSPSDLNFNSVMCR